MSIPGWHAHHGKYIVTGCDKLKCSVISHRGANRHAPQNTLPAFEKSLDIGVDGFETDIHVTCDGIPVVCHNYTIDETSNGKGSIQDLNLSELKKYDFGSYFSDKYKGTQIPTLDEFLTLCENADIEILNIELKSPKKPGTGIVEKTISSVKQHGLYSKLIISSFDDKILVEAKRIDPTCRTGLLYCIKGFCSYKVLFAPVKYARSINAEYLHPHFSHVTPGYIFRAHRNGIKVNVWTVDKPLIAKYLYKIGTDGIITNWPEMVNKIIKK